MAYKHILYQEKERIGILTLNRPEKRNALGKEAELEMMDCFQRADDEKKARVILLKGNGPIFCSGQDRQEDLNQPLTDVRDLFQTCIDMYALMRAIPQPIIAQVHGIAMAGGCQYAKELMASQALWPDAVEGFTASIEKPEPVWKET